MPDDSHAEMLHQNQNIQTHAEGHQLGGRRPHRRPAHLGLITVCVVTAAGLSAAWGLYSRDKTENQLAALTLQQAITAVHVTHPSAMTAPRTLVLPGDVQAFYEAPIYARVNGYLHDWTADIGAHVKAGQTLGAIDTPDLDQQLAQAQADMATAQARAALAELTAKRWHALLATNSVSQQSADEKQGDALAARAETAASRAHVDQLRALETFKHLTAPFDGVVTARNIDVGALINEGARAKLPLFKVADMHEMRVYVRVPQAYASALSLGQTATLTEPQYPGLSFPAVMNANSQSVARDSRTVLVEYLAPNGQQKLWPGSYAQVTLTLPTPPGVLLVPAGALVFRAHGAQLAAVKDGRVVMKDVLVGKNLGENIEILHGVTLADKIIVAPPDDLEAGQAVKIER